MTEFLIERNKALSWWNKFSFEERFYKVIPWLKEQGQNVTERHPNSLTGREIQNIYSSLNKTS